MLPWKMLLGPALLLGMKGAKIEYDNPKNLLIIRVVYGISQALLFALCAFIYQAISKRGDEKKTVKIVTPPSPMAPDEGPKETTMTHKNYDKTELMKLFKNFGLGAVITVGIHYYMAVVPALILQIVTQPITLFEHPLFSIYVLNKDSNENEALKRPFPDNSPAARIEAMKQAATKPAELAAAEETEGEGETPARDEPTAEASGGDAKIAQTSAEKRPARPSSAVPREE